jgi:dTMP kinase
MSVERGRFITFEGGEGAGKSTQVSRLCARLRARGLIALSTREPGGTPRAERLRALILSGGARALGPEGEALLFAAARMDHLDVVIRPALARGEWVACDRFMDSTRAYQGRLGDLRPEMIASLERVTLDGTRPDLTLILDLPAEIGLARAAARRGGGAADRFEAEGLDSHHALREAFLEIARREPERCVVIDAAQSPDVVEEAIWDAVESRLEPRAAERGRGA